MPPHVTPEFESPWAKHALRISQILDDPQLPIITIDNVAEYYYYGSDQEYWDLRNDFPNLAPPFQVFWVEHKMVQKIRSAEKGEKDMSNLGMREPRSGFLFLAVKPEDVTLAPDDRDDRTSSLPEGTHWIYAIEMFNYWGTEQKQKLAEGPTGTMFMFIDKEGRVLDTPQMQTHTSQQALDRDPVMAEVLKATMQWTHPSLLAICFLHCRNVKVVNNETPSKLAKRTIERHGYKPSSYKTLIIEPLKDILRKEGGHSASGGNTLQRALHICRGHFRDYREGKGLFGKYHQIVWTPQTVRGTSHSKGQKPAPREIEVRLL